MLSASDRRARHRGTTAPSRKARDALARLLLEACARVRPLEDEAAALCGAPRTPTSCERPTRTRAADRARAHAASTSSSASSRGACSRTRPIARARGRRRGRGSPSVQLQLTALGTAAFRASLSPLDARRPPRPRARERRARARERPPPALPALAADAPQARPVPAGPVSRCTSASSRARGGRRGRDQRALPQPAPREAPGARRDGRGRIDPRALLNALVPRAAPQSRRRRRVRPRGDGEL